MTISRRAGASPSAAAAEAALGLGFAGTRLAIRLRAVRRTSAIIALIIAAMAVAVTRLRMALRTIVAILAALALMPAIGLGMRPLLPLRLGLRGGLQPLERFGRRGEIGRQRRDRNALPRRALDVAQVAALLGAAEGDCDPGCSGARGAADAMDILLGNVGQVEVHDVADARDVDAARGDVGGDEHRHVARLERRNRALALRLALVAVDRAGGDARGLELTHDLVGAVLGAAEHEGALDLFGFEDHRKQRGFLGLVYHRDAL